MVDGVGVPGLGQKARVVALGAEVVRRENQDIPFQNLSGIVLLQAVFEEARSVALRARHMVKGAVALEEGWTDE